MIRCTCLKTNLSKDGKKDQLVRAYGSGPGRDNEDSDQEHGAGEKWSHSRYKLKVRSAGCPDKLDVGYEKKKIRCL